MKKNKNNYEECLRDFGHLFRTEAVLKNQTFVQEVKQNNDNFAKGYVYGLTESVSLLKQLAVKYHIPLQDLGINDLNINDILGMVND